MSRMKNNRKNKKGWAKEEGGTFCFLAALWILRSQDLKSYVLYLSSFKTSTSPIIPFSLGSSLANKCHIIHFSL